MASQMPVCKGWPRQKTDCVGISIAIRVREGDFLAFCNGRHGDDDGRVYLGSGAMFGAV